MLLRPEASIPRMWQPQNGGMPPNTSRWPRMSAGAKQKPGAKPIRPSPRLTAWPNSSERSSGCAVRWPKRLPSSTSEKTLHLTRSAQGQGPGGGILMSALNEFAPEIGLAPDTGCSRWYLSNQHVPLSSPSWRHPTSYCIARVKSTTTGGYFVG